MSGPEGPESAQVKLMREWGLGFEKRDAGLIAETLHKDFRRIAGVMNLWTDDEVIPYQVPHGLTPADPSSLPREGHHSRPYSKLVKIERCL